MLEAGKALCNFGVAFSFQKRLCPRNIPRRRTALRKEDRDRKWPMHPGFFRFPDLSNSSQNGECHHKARSSIRSSGPTAFSREAKSIFSPIEEEEEMWKNKLFLNKKNFLPKSETLKLTLARKMSLALSISSRD